MDKQIHPVGSKLRVTKDHDVTWATPWPKEGDVLSVVGDYTIPHTFGCNETVYVTKNEAGQRVLVREDCIKAYVDPLPEGTLVFVKETHNAKEGKYMKVYAGDHLTIVEFSRGSDDVPAHYWCVDATGDYRALLPDKIALVESPPTVSDKLCAPPAPTVAGTPGEDRWHERGTDLEGRWTYSKYWGWSNFVPSNSERYKQLEAGTDMRYYGMLAVG